MKGVFYGLVDFVTGFLIDVPDDGVVDDHEEAGDSGAFNGVANHVCVDLGEEDVSVV